MGIFNIGRRNTNIRETKARLKEKLLRAGVSEDKAFDMVQLQEGRLKEQDKSILIKRKLLEKQQQLRDTMFKQTGFALGKHLGGFAQVPQEDFSFQEQVLRETIGGRGDKIWGTIGEPVQINNDLNPRQRGDTSTGELFGF